MKIPNNAHLCCNFREWDKQKYLYERDPEDVLIFFSSSEYYPW